MQRLGQWIDHHMPRDTGASPFGFQADRYPPTVDFAVTARGRMRVGFWDDRGTVALTFQLNGQTAAILPARPNGAFA